MSNHNTLDYLLQKDIVEDFIPQIGRKSWETVFLDDEKEKFTIYSALLKSDASQRVLTNANWEIQIGEGRPCLSKYFTKDGISTEYHRFGREDGVRPLVIARDFHGAWPSYAEVCEEFRHFHNLAEDKGRGLLLAFDKSGYEVEVARIQDHQIEIAWPYLIQFLSATQLHLVIYFDSVRYSQIDVDSVPIQKRSTEHQDERCRYSLYIDRCDNFFKKECASYSRLLGKVLISPPPINQCGEWPREQEKQYISFIIGINPNGTVREYICNPNALGANPEAPHYLTPVYFRREVLQKYYAEPERYSVEDGHLRCLDLWGMQIDNNHPNYVVVFLGDLGRDLPYPEQLHWKQYNVSPPANDGLSETNFRRSFLAEFAEPKSEDLIFRNSYRKLNDTWREQFGWPLFLDLEYEDKHILSAIHIPVTQSQRELNEQVLWLVKLLVDSLNENELQKNLSDKIEGEKGIGKFERFLRSICYPYADALVRLLRDLQTIRSNCAAHRRGENCEKIMNKLGLSGKSVPEVMKELLQRTIDELEKLHSWLKGQYGNQVAAVDFHSDSRS